MTTTNPAAPAAPLAPPDPARIAQTVATTLPFRGEVAGLTPLAGDASNRRYFRIALKGAPSALILMQLADPEGFKKSEEAVSGASVQIAELPFTNVLTHLQRTGATVPQLHYYDREAGLLYLEDFGDLTLAEACRDADRARLVALYRQAIDQLVLLQVKGTNPPAPGCIAFHRRFDVPLLMWEFDHFLEYGITARIGRPMKPEDERAIRSEFQRIAELLAGQPQVFVHRDYHSRNLMVDGSRIGIIDFQDALMGPATYDLASLFKDAYIELDDARGGRAGRSFSRRPCRPWAGLDRSGLVPPVIRLHQHSTQPQSCRPVCLHRPGQTQSEVSRRHPSCPGLRETEFVEVSRTGGIASARGALRSRVATGVKRVAGARPFSLEVSRFTSHTSRLHHMKAMILAAGLGTRLRPLTDITPKPLLPVAGTPMIVWNVLLLKRHGIQEVVINLHHLGAMIPQALGDGSAFGMRIRYSHEPVILGTGGGIKQAEPYFHGEPVLILNGDTLFELDLGALMAFHRGRQAAATLVLRQDPEAARWGLVEVTDRGDVVRITGRGREGSASTTGRMFAGIHILHPRLLRDVPVGTRNVLDHRCLCERYSGGGANSGIRFRAATGAMWGTPERYAQAERDAAAGLLSLAARTPDGVSRGTPVKREA
jgi:aminoglycoside/choline kinase family phosphotransferase/choline kinase